MFFDPADYLEADPAAAGSPREAERLRREAEQRAKFCATMTRLVGEGGFGAAKIYLAAREAGLGLGTYYKLYETPEACLVEAFRRCAATLLDRVGGALAGSGGDPGERAAAALGQLAADLSSDRDVARLLLVEIRAGESAGREAHEEWSAALAELLGGECEGLGADSGAAARMVVGSLLAWLAADVRAERGASPRRALPELTFIALAPYLGAEAAALEMRRRQEELIRAGGG